MGWEVAGGTQRVELLFNNKTYTLSHYGSVCSIGSPKKGFWYGQLFLLSQYCASPFLRITAIFSPCEQDGFFIWKYLRGVKKAKKVSVHLMYRPLITMTSHYVVIKIVSFCIRRGKGFIKGLKIAVILKKGDAQYWLSKKSCPYQNPFWGDPIEQTDP